MVAESVSLPPALRPWHRAGVDFLLADEALPAPYSLCIATPIATGGRIGAGIEARVGAHAPHTSPHTSPHGFAQGNSPNHPPAAAVVPTGGPRAGAASAQGSGAARPAHAATGTAQARQASQFSGPTGVTSADDPSQLRQATPAQPSLPPDKWPAIWQQRLQKTAPAAVLWTYWALGEDMCVRPNPARRTLLQKMLADLGHPAGTHSFWPAALPQSLDTAPAQNPALPPSQPPDQSSVAPLSATSDPTDSSEILLYPAPEVFWSGVQLLKARAVVVMGSPALKALGLPARLRPFQQTRHRGTLVVVLRDVDFLAQELTRYDAVKAFLRQALAPFGR